MKDKFSDFIQDYQARIADLEKRKHIAYYQAAVTGETVYYDEYARLEIEHAGILSNHDDFAFLEKVTQRVRFTDPLMERQAKILYNIYKAHQIPDKLQQEIIQLETGVANKFSLFRTEVGDEQFTDNQVEDLLESSTDSDQLYAFWEASKKVGNLVEEDVRKLVALRNQAAVFLGYSNYHTMSLTLSEQDPYEIDRLFDQLDKLTANGFKTVKKGVDHQLASRLEIEEDKLKPWHYQDRFFQEAPKVRGVDLDQWYQDADLVALTREYFQGIGLPIDDLLSKSDLFEKPGKNQHAFCLHVDRYGDVRVLCNVKPNRKWMNTMLHEFGHAVYEKYYDAQLPFILREPAHIFTTEAVAMFFGRLASNPQWMHEVGLLNASVAVDLAQRNQEVTQREQLVFSRWAQVMYRFEKSLYANPGQDLNQLWWKLVNRYQKLQPPDTMRSAYWASKIHIATAPCYYHNYLLGELLASQFYDSLEKLAENTGKKAEASYANRTDIGLFFRNEVFSAGSSLHWADMIRRATGESLDPMYYARQFT